MGACSLAYTSSKGRLMLSRRLNFSKEMVGGCVGVVVGVVVCTSGHAAREALFEEVMVVVVRVLVFPVLIVVSSFPFVSNVFHKTG